MTSRPALSLLSLVTLTVGTGALLAQEQAERIPLPSPNQVSLQNRQFSPEPGIDPQLRATLEKAALPVTHFLVQLQKPLNAQTKAALEEKGIRLLEFLHGTTYFAAIRRGVTLEWYAESPIRWAGPIQPEDKLEPALLRERYAYYGINWDGTLNILVVFHRDVGRADAEAILKRHKSKYEPYSSSDQWKVVLPRGALRALAAADEVKWIEQGPLPFLPLNDQVRNAIGVDTVQNVNLSSGQPVYNGLDGSGVRVAVMDSGVDPDHDDFWEHDSLGHRTTLRLNHQSGVGAHGTHVGGMIAASGYQSNRTNSSGTANGGTPYQWRGMAPNATLLSYGGAGGNSQVYYDAINLMNAEVSNHSYVQTCMTYNATASDVDTIVRGDGTYSGTAIPARTTVWAAANNGTYAQYCGSEGYFSLLSPAKNPIVVASTNADDLSSASRSYFSSLGPTLDGRLKPDVAAPGCKTAASIQSAGAGTNGYIGMCGTSMAAPATTGTVALLLQQWHNTYGAIAPYPSTLKAVLIQGATDLVDTVNSPGEMNNPDTGAPVQYHAGPDYATGYGLINAVASRDIVAQRRIVEDQISVAGQVDTYQVLVPAGAARLRVTLAWDDEPGSPSTANTTAKIVNDLDLELKDPLRHTVLPWTLPALSQAATPGDPDPIVPGDIKAAVRGVDRLNNVEQVEVSSPTQGTWDVKVKGFNLPNGHAQSYSLTADFGLQMTFTPLPPVPPELPYCVDIPWEPILGTGISISLARGWRCGFVPLPPICRYAINCPGCGPFGYCPGFQMKFPLLPESLRIRIYDDRGKLVAADEERRPSRSLSFKPEVGMRYFLIFLADPRRPLEGKYKIPIEINVMKGEAGTQMKSECLASLK